MFLSYQRFLVHWCSLGERSDPANDADWPRPPGNGFHRTGQSAPAAKARPAHHLKFAQPRSLGRKVSDEFTVPLCRDHHQQLHRHGDEIAWWANLQIAPLKMAEELWDA